MKLGEKLENSVSFHLEDYSFHIVQMPPIFKLPYISGIIIKYRPDFKNSRIIMSIILENVTKTYVMGELKVSAVNDLSLSIKEGEFIVILGASGSGKTTLLNLLGGIDGPTSGSVLFNFEGENRLEGMSESDLTLFRRKYVGFVFQFYNLAASLTALENVELAARLVKSTKPPEEISKELLIEVGLEKMLNKFPSQLSGGEQQRVAIARALAKQPRILLADEPTGNIDSHTTEKLMNIFKRINKEHNVTVIMVTHNEAIASLADRVIKLRDGRIVSE